MTNLPTAGQLRQAVSLQAPTRPAADSFGQRQPAFSTVATVPALVEQKSGQELTQAQRQREVLSYTITIRYWPNLNSAWQVLFNGILINLQTVSNPDGLQVWHVLTGTGFGSGGGA